MRISDWSSDVCSSDLSDPTLRRRPVRGIAMTASVVRLRRSAFSYLLRFGLLVAASFLAFGAVTAPAWGQSTATPAAGPTGGSVPGNVQGNPPASAFWRAVSQGEVGTVTIPNAGAGRRTQTAAEQWGGAVSYRLGFGRLGSASFLAIGAVTAPAWGQSTETPAAGPTGGEVPGNVQGNRPASDFWRAVRQGEVGNVTIPNAGAGLLIQSEGDNWRAVRNGPVTVYGAWLMLGTVIVLALFFALRGRIRIEAGPSGTTIQRFNMVERTAHWITAVSFVVLALTGLNVLYGRHVLLPILGPDIFSAITLAGKYVHNFLAFAFMVGVVIIFLLWVRHNIPRMVDLTWMATGGGILKKGVHPAAGTFNAGQKFIFWASVLLAISIRHR